MFGHHAAAVPSPPDIPLSTLTKDQCRAELSALSGGRCPIPSRHSLQAHRNLVSSLHETKRAGPGSLNIETVQQMNTSDSEDQEKDTGDKKWSKHDFARLCHVIVDPQVSVAITQILDGRSRLDIDARENPWTKIAERFDNTDNIYHHPDPEDEYLNTAAHDPNRAKQGT